MTESVLRLLFESDWSNENKAMLKVVKCINSNLLTRIIVGQCTLFK